MILLKNCRLVPFLTEGYEGNSADVVLSGKRIESICAPGTLPADEGAFDEVLDLAGKTLLPGFIDLHTHLYFRHEDIPALAADPPAVVTMNSVVYAQDKLRYGYTTLRDCGCSDGAAFAVRDSVRAGEIEGPRIIAPGRCITPSTRGNDAFGRLYCEFDDPAQAMGVVRREVAAGAEFIKYMATGAVLNPGGDPNMAITTREETQALVDAAASLGTYVAAHCHGTHGMKYCIETGVRSIEHATYIDRECIDLILRYGGRTFLVPTLAIVWALRDGIVGAIPDEVKQKIDVVSQQILVNIRRAYDAGVRLGWGTDIDRDAFLKAPFLEFSARSEMGFDCRTLLLQATAESAELLGMGETIGTVRAGKTADLVVLDGKPDENLRDLCRRPVFVFAEGRRFHG